jgi:plasmid stabilization system protein ParE
MNLVVELSPAAEADLERRFDFLLDPANATQDLDHAFTSTTGWKPP